jgi:hypothetical protein
MKGPPGLALLCVFGCLSLACVDNHPLAADAAVKSPAGAAGTTGTHPSGAAGSAGETATGGAGATQGDSGSGGAIQDGTGGTTAKGCDVTTLVNQTYNCTLPGACHDAAMSATGLDMTSLDWPQKLVGTLPSNGPNIVSPSLCLSVNEPYLIKGTLPAQGLFLDKFKANPPCGTQMPDLGVPVSAEDLDCFQRWANALTTQ